jgi:Flp pilus assembly pilin Flp
MKKLIAFFKDEDGLETSEYAVMGALIILLVTAAISGLSGAISDTFTTMTGVVDGSNTNP